MGRDRDASRVNSAHHVRSCNLKRAKRAKETNENGDAKHSTAYIGHLYGGQTDFPFPAGHGDTGAVEGACDYLVAEAETEYLDARFTHRDIGDIRNERIDPFQIFI